MDIFLSQIVFLISELTEQGLTVVAFGLCGVFLVLLLFFVTIIIMQAIVDVFEKRAAKKKNAGI
jgi:Na+-transporting methylmalonyl-CoA/oxaloacetate decarboxylase gamma subunit